MLTPDEVADLLRMGRVTVLRKAASGQLGRFQDGHKVLFTEAHVKAYIAAHSCDAEPMQIATRPQQRR